MGGFHTVACLMAACSIGILVGRWSESRSVLLSFGICPPSSRFECCRRELDVLRQWRHRLSASGQWRLRPGQTKKKQTLQQRPWHELEELPRECLEKFMGGDMGRVSEPVKDLWWHPRPVTVQGVEPDLSSPNGVRSAAGLGRSLLAWVGHPRRKRRSTALEAQLVDAIREDMREGYQLRVREAQQLRQELERAQAALPGLVEQSARLDQQLTEESRECAIAFESSHAMEEARALLRSCQRGGALLPGPVPVWKGYFCSVPSVELERFLDYTPRELCPDDWFRTQDIIFRHHCFSLPMRRCASRTPPQPVEPLPFPQSLFAQQALADESVRWGMHGCKSYECLNRRRWGDCLPCFNMTLEAGRWRSSFRGALTLENVLEMKRGHIRLGLDAGGGSGSFAAHLARHGATIVTTAMDITWGKKGEMGIPYMETIALRGLIPMHLPHKARLPFFDNTLDIVHSVDPIRRLTPLEFEELVFEWDRVLLPGGIMWFEMFYAPMEEMALYIVVIELLGYKRLAWNLTPKPESSVGWGAHLYLNCVIEKPVRPDH